MERKGTVKIGQTEYNQIMEKSFDCQETFLILPISNKEPKTKKDPKPSLSLIVDNKVVRSVTGAFANSEKTADWWAFLDISEFKGKEVTLRIDPISEQGFALIKQAEKVPGSDSWGEEPNRPQFHFSQKVGWSNDPNGMVYYKDEYHLYFQHNPVGLPWGNMSWGHAVSKDLVRWEQLPNVFHHRQGDAMFSGGGAIDWKNTGGWKTGKDNVLFVTWTSTGRGECIAFSNDRGRTFTEYEGNPIIKHKGRDPKPIWYEYGKEDESISDQASELGGHWVIAVFDEEQDGKIAFYTSTDLKTWTKQSDLQGYHECPELFQLPVDGNEGDRRWVIYAADSKYKVGDFDGRKFTAEHEDKHQLHWGPYYASQRFSEAPDQRIIQIGWARIDMKDSPFNQAFSFPTELSLRRTKNGIRMFGEPVKEIQTIHGKMHKAENKALSDEASVEFQTKGALFDIRATFELGTAKTIGLYVAGEELFHFDCVSKRVKKRPVELIDGKLYLQILIDRPMTEIFVNRGERILTSPYKNSLNIESVRAVARGGKAKLVSLEVYELDAAWR